MKYPIAAALALCAFAAPAQAADLTVTVSADQSRAQISSTDGYTVHLANATGDRLSVSQLSFLLPGHGVSPIPQDQPGSPFETPDHTPAFHYVAGSSSGAVTSDPSQHDRWLTWSTAFDVPALSTQSFHFSVQTSMAQAFYVVGATARASSSSGDASVLGLAAGAMVRINGDDHFDIATTVNQDHALAGSVLTYTTTFTNLTSEDASIAYVKIGTIAAEHYVSGSTRGVLSDDPIRRGKTAPKWTWTTPYVVPAHSSVELTYSMRFDSGTGGIHLVRSRAYFAPSFFGAAFAGAGPEAPVNLN